ncbi:MAG: sigma-54 dependent transcriptional regulator [Planctomycetota bacterium]
MDRILVVEDERAQRMAIATYLQKTGYEVVAVETAEEALERLSHISFSVLLTDLRLPGIDGLTLIRRARDLDDDLGVLLTTAYASIDSAVEALRCGAHDYLLKPLILEEIGRKIDGLLQQRELLRENARLRRALNERQPGEELVSGSRAMKGILDWVQRAAAAQSTVLVTGETGTGKEVVARAIHRLSQHADEPFLAINLAALPEAMAESELFGHEKGAFTGAERRRDGVLRTAGRGTVFLDEIAELPLPGQAKLLRALEAREVQPLGEDRAVPFEARIIVATHRDLEERVREGEFREDLYYRFNVIRIHVPPLRERLEDIPALAHHLLKRHAARSGTAIPQVAADAMRALCTNRWRGNVRELSNVLERAMILADDGRIDLEQLPPDIRGEVGPTLNLTEAVAGFERGHIAMVLRLCDGNRERAAAELGISPATLYRRLEKLALKSSE